MILVLNSRRSQKFIA